LHEEALITVLFRVGCEELYGLNTVALVKKHLRSDLHCCLRRGISPRQDLGFCSPSSGHVRLSAYEISGLSVKALDQGQFLLSKICDHGQCKKGTNLLLWVTLSGCVIEREPKLMGGLGSTVFTQHVSQARSYVSFNRVDDPGSKSKSQVNLTRSGS
jgi:hypothetical protein